MLTRLPLRVQAFVYSIVETPVSPFGVPLFGSVWVFDKPLTSGEPRESPHLPSQEMRAVMGRSWAVGPRAGPQTSRLGQISPPRMQGLASSWAMGTSCGGQWSHEVLAAARLGRQEDPGCDPSREGAGGGAFHSQAQRCCDWVGASCSCVVPSGRVFCYKGWMQRLLMGARALEGRGHLTWGWAPVLGAPSFLQCLLWKMLISVGAAGLALSIG